MGTEAEKENTCTSDPCVHPESGDFSTAGHCLQYKCPNYLGFCQLHAPDNLKDYN